MNPKRYTVSREKRFRMGELINEGKTLIEAENIVLAGDQNRSRNTDKWREMGLYPYGTLDSPNDESMNYFPEMESVIKGKDTERTKTESITHYNIKKNTFDEYLQSLSAEDVLRLAVTRFGISTDEIDSVSPRLKRSAAESMTVTVRLPKELVKRVKEKLSAEGMSMSRVIEEALFQYIGSPQDMVDKGKSMKKQLRHYLKLIEKAGLTEK